MKLISITIVLLTLFMGSLTLANDNANRKEQLLTANAVHLDPLFPYYANRSAESIALEIKVNNYDAVYYFATTPFACNKELITTLQNEGIPVVLVTFPCWVLVKPEQLDKFLPKNWREWQMEFSGNKDNNHTFIGLIYPEYNKWYADYICKMINEFGFDGFTMLETMYPNYNGLDFNPPQMGDMSEEFRQAFASSTGYKNLPNFVDHKNPLYYKNTPELTKAWEDFRVKTVNDFMFDILSKVRISCPDIAIITWALGISDPTGAEKIRFYNGMDTYSMVARVQPDIHIIQTHWPDWCNPKLKPNYLNSYKHYIDEAKKACPMVKVGVQSDYGSLPEMRRSMSWVEEHRTVSEQLLDTFLVYEFNIRDEVYSESPVLKEIITRDDELLLVFDQRIAKTAEEIMLNRELTSQNDKFPIKKAKVDGNILRCQLSKMPNSNTSLTVNVGGIADVPEVRLPLSQHEPKPKGRINYIPENHKVTIYVKEEK